MRLTAALFTPIGDAAPGEDDTEREIHPTDPAVLADDHLIDMMSAQVGRALLAEPYAPRPELLKAERVGITRHCRRARRRTLLRRVRRWFTLAA